jgi:hypothetical protein
MGMERPLACTIRNLAGKPTGFKAVIGAYGWLEMPCDLIEEIGDAVDFGMAVWGD